MSGWFSSLRFLTPSQKSQVIADLDAQVLAFDHGVEMAQFEVALGAAEALRELLVRRLGDHARPGEVELCAGLGDADVGE